MTSLINMVSAGDKAISLHPPAHRCTAPRSRSFHFSVEGGILGSLRTEVTKSSMRSSNPTAGEGGILGLANIRYSSDFEHKFSTLKLSPALQMYVEARKLPQINE